MKQQLHNEIPALIERKFYPSKFAIQLGKSHRTSRWGRALWRTLPQTQRDPQMQNGNHQCYRVWSSKTMLSNWCKMGPYDRYKWSYGAPGNGHINGSLVRGPSCADPSDLLLRIPVGCCSTCILCRYSMLCIYIYVSYISICIHLYIYIHMNMQIYYVQVVVGTERWISTIIPSREKVLFLRF